MKRLALLLLCSLPAAQATELGRLFHTPQQRAALDRGETPVPPPARLEGVVQKHGGGRTVWIDGAMQRSELDGDPRQHALEGQSLTVGQPPRDTRTH